MNKDEELINDLGIVLRDYTETDSKLDSSKKIMAMGSLLADIIAKSGLSPEEVLCHLNGSNEVNAKQKTALDELRWREEQIALSSDVLDLIGKRLQKLNRLTLDNIIDIIERIVICGYEAAGLSKEEIEVRLINLPEEHARKGTSSDNESGGRE